MWKQNKHTDEHTKSQKSKVLQGADWWPVLKFGLLFKYLRLIVFTSLQLNLL